MSNVYSKSPLTEISLELKFANFYNIKENIPKFYDEIKENFKYNTVNMEPKLSINITNQNGEIKTTHEPSSWVFHETEDINESPLIVELGNDYCLLDFRVYLGEYLGFDEFKKYIDLMINAISIFNIKEFNSIGLRYINNIKCSKGNPLKWESIISSKLLLQDLLGEYESPSRLMSQFTFEKNNFFINFQFGIFNTEFPNPIARKEFILDLDCICNDETNISEIDDLVIEMHETISSLFEEMILEEYKEFIR